MKRLMLITGKHEYTAEIADTAHLHGRVFQADIAYPCIKTSIVLQHPTEQPIVSPYLNVKLDELDALIALLSEVRNNCEYVEQAEE